MKPGNNELVSGHGASAMENITKLLSFLFVYA